MYEVPKKEWFYILIKNGPFIKFNNYQELLVYIIRNDYASCISKNINDIEAFKTYPFKIWPYNHTYHETKAVVYDAYLNPINPVITEIDIYKANRYTPSKAWFFKKKQRAGAKFRSGAIPGIFKHRRGRRYYRQIRTKQERREALYNKEYVRSARNFKNLPNSYDDILYSRCGRSWKNNKKFKQWAK